MANDYISRDYAVENMENFPWDTEHDKNAAIHLVRELVPAADVRPVVRGTWIHREAFDYYDQNNVTHFHAQCSNCGFLHDFIDCHSAQYLFCPECGADMRPEGRAKE